LNIKPLEVRLIDFERARLDSERTDGTVLGTPGYFPCYEGWTDGTYKWDIWAFAAMICEADMGFDEYLNVKTDTDIKRKIGAHL